MKPIGPLMWEHRLIEKMLGVLMGHMDRQETGKIINPVIIGVTVDFIRTYADRTHHGKEEENLFRDLAIKELTIDLQSTMQELLDDHAWARKKTAQIVAAKDMYLSDEEDKITEIIHLARELGSFYPKTSRKRISISFTPARNTSAHPNMKRCWLNSGNSTAK